MSGAEKGDDIAFIDTQRTGRMGELVAELELLRRGWIVGNFNSTTANSAGWDLFAAKGRRSVKIRVKAKRVGTASFRWAAKANGRIFIGDSEGDDDFVVAVSFEGDGHRIWVVPTHIVQTTLDAENALWLSGQKRNGERRKATPMRNLYINDRDDGTASHGFGIKWAAYENAWHLLDRPAL